MSRRHYDNKLMIWDLLQAINADPAAVADLLRANSSQSVIFDGPHPINHLAGADGIVHGFWRPLLAAFPDLIRRPYILMGGESFDGSEWVSSTGDFIATFAKDWLLEGVTIPASRTTVRIRYGEFCKIEAGQISQIVLLLDLPDLLWQAGHNIFPPSLGSEIWIPGPLAGDGILLEPQDEGVSRESVRIVEAMLDGLRRYDGKSKESMGMVRFWRLDMLWYGPRGIGTTYGLSGFEDYHQMPFLRAFPDRKGGNHVARFGNGRYACSTGWPSIYASHEGPYLDVAGTGKTVSMRVMDWWTRRGELLYENWVFVDMIDLSLQLGRDPMANL